MQSLTLPGAEWVVSDLDPSIDTTFPPAQVKVRCQSMILLGGSTPVLTHLVMIDLKLVEMIDKGVAALKNLAVVGRIIWLLHHGIG